ncbi:MFS transporter [Sporolituus thermophilus]|uniref:Predicted arabinose efflux permease, MFS family n=1 Tax=Sporolituus thermophilus DSM 23256 TaxID=1123285 RepID=A0A1G7LQQ2_9FIRM|nr:MFS transporter [Sporolituus thermophilus]SDF51837.1 Predicted arabinose efflux permease, MFS family [Sporolituus thermophilus DSM 23256]
MAVRDSADSLRERLWTRDFILICTINLLIFCGFQMLLPTLPVYAKHLGGSDAAAGLIVGIFTVAAVIMRPVAGQALDYYGRKGIFLSGLAVFISAVLAYIWAPSLGILLLIRFIHGFGWGATSTAASTVAADIIPKARLGEGMGYFGLTTTAAMAFAPALGLYLTSHFSFSVLFLVSAFIVTIAAGLALSIGYRHINAANAKTVLLEKVALRPALVIFFVTMTYGAIVAFLALYAAQQGIGNIGPFFTAYATALAVARPLAGRLADRRGFDIVVIPGLVLVMVAMFLLYLAQGLAWFLAAGIVYGAGFGAVQPGLQAMAVLQAPPNRRGAANATFFIGFDLGIGFSSVIWGLVSQLTGYKTMYLWTMAPALLALSVYIVFGRRTSQLTQ